MNAIIELAQRIDKANKTLSTQTELVEFVGQMGSPFSLCVQAARKIINGNGKLSFI